MPNSASLALIAALTLTYLAAAATSNRRFRQWPMHRICSWIAGAACAALALNGPLAEQAHGSFPAHMLTHLLLGMLAPLFVTLAAPVTLALRTMPVSAARRISRFTKCRPVRMIMNPLTASILSIGGLWWLYSAGLYSAMHHDTAIYALVHGHLFASGYLYAATLLQTDPVPRRFRFGYRAFILLLSAAGHSVLSKWIYATPPEGVPVEQAQAGAVLMYYGGDLVEIALILVIFTQWAQEKAKQAPPGGLMTLTNGS